MNKSILLAVMILLAETGIAPADPVEISPHWIGTGENHSWLHIEFDDGAIYVFDVSYDGPSTTTSRMVQAIADETTLTYTTQFSGMTLYGLDYDGHHYQDWLTGFWSLWFRDVGQDQWTYSPAGWTTLTAVDGQWHGLVADPGFTYDASPSELVLVIPGDLNDDGFVGQVDLDMVLGEWGNSPPADPRADPTGDGFVGQPDLDTVLAHWGRGYPPPAAPVPEPVGPAMLGVGVLALMSRRKHPR